MKARNNKSTLKRLSRDILSQRYLFALATVGTIIQVALTVYLPILIGDAVDAVLKMNAVLLMSRLIWQMLVVILANSAIQWLNPLIYNRLIYSYSESLRERVMMKIHAMPLSYLDRQGTGDYFCHNLYHGSLRLVHDALSPSHDAFVNACGTFYRKEELSTLSQSN